MGIPVIVGWGSKIKRTGGTLQGRCGECKRDVKLYEAVKHENVSAFFAISLWDDEERVVQCGECLAVYEAKHIDALKGPARLPSAHPKRPAIDEGTIDAELAAMKKRLGK